VISNRKYLQPRNGKLCVFGLILSLLLAIVFGIGLGDDATR